MSPKKPRVNVDVQVNVAWIIFAFSELILMICHFW